MKKLSYVDFPKIPEELLLSIEGITDPNRPKPVTRGTPKYWIEGFSRKTMNDELIEWLHNNLPIKIDVVQYQVISQDVRQHTDLTTYAYNYQLTLGGPDVRTEFADESGNIVETHVIPTYQWVRLKSDVLHGVAGIEPGQLRIAVNIRTSEHYGD